MRSNQSRNAAFDRKSALRIVGVFTAVLAVGMLALLRWAGFTFWTAANVPIGRPQISSAPFFSEPLPAASAPGRTSEPASEQVADLPKRLSQPLKKEPTLRATVQKYLEALQQIEARKRALLHTFIQLSPDLQAVVQRQLPDSTAEADLDRTSVSLNSFNEKRSSEFALKSLPTDEWEHLISSVESIEPPAGCSELHEVYSAHIKALRDSVVQQLSDAHGNNESSKDHKHDRGMDNESLWATARRADTVLGSVCDQNGLLKTFGIAVEAQ